MADSEVNLLVGSIIKSLESLKQINQSKKERKKRNF
jgi:hypothetical protein